MPPPYSVVAKKKKTFFLCFFSWSYQGLQQCFFKEMYSSLISTVCCLSSFVLTSDLCCSSLWCDCSIVSSNPCPALDDFLSPCRRWANLHASLHQTHTRKFRDDYKAALFGGIKGSRFWLVSMTYPMLVDAHSEATVYSDPVFANNKYITHISL